MDPPCPNLFHSARNYKRARVAYSPTSEDIREKRRRMDSTRNSGVKEVKWRVLLYL